MWKYWIFSEHNCKQTDVEYFFAAFPVSALLNSVFTKYFAHSLMRCGFALLLQPFIQILRVVKALPWVWNIQYQGILARNKARWRGCPVAAGLAGPGRDCYFDAPANGFDPNQLPGNVNWIQDAWRVECWICGVGSASSAAGTVLFRQWYWIVSHLQS